ncbi:MAG: asparagine synthase-related protein [Methanomassiliicoccaceae archaeon]|nr:asparagine synthase-related protein [Methanomassiliicoccaceae archaeon]
MTSDPGPLSKALDNAIRNAVSGKDVGIAFSGGLDSGVVAAIAGEYAAKARLYTVGSKDSRDVEEARSSAEELRMEWAHIPLTEDGVKEGLREMISITGTKDPVTLSFELPLFFVCMNCEEEEIITGQGADELFAGYSKYIGLSGDDLKRRTAEDMRKLSEVTIPHERKVAEHFGKKIHYPFLDKEVVKEARAADNGCAPDGSPGSRKRTLREVSDIIGCPWLSVKEKRSAQYSSGAMALIKKICRDGGMTYAELIGTLSGEEM